MWPRRKRGVGLLELLLALVVVAVFLVFAAKRYKVYELHQNEYVLAKTVNTLINGINGFYFQECTRNEWPLNANRYGIQNIYTYLRIPNRSLNNPFGPITYTFGSFDTKVPNQRYYSRLLYLRIPFDKHYANEMGYFKSRFNATNTYSDGKGSGLEWRFAPFNPNQPQNLGSDANWIIQVNMRKYMQSTDPSNACWFPQ